MADDDLLELVDLREDQDSSARKQLTPRGERLPYEAYRKRAKPPHLKIRLAGMGKRAPVYNHLLDIASNAAETELELVFRFLIVRIRGKNLGAVIDAIENHVCDFIQEYNPLIFARPASDAPIIEVIEFPVEDQERQR